jgi:hypothetical protein
MQLRPLDNDWPEHIDYSKQTIEVPGTKKPGETRTPAFTLRTELTFVHCFLYLRVSNANSCIPWWYVSPFPKSKSRTVSVFLTRFPGDS